MGIVSEVLPTFCRKPLFGYPLIVMSGVFIGFLGFAVWSHHMFTVGLGVVATTAFSLMTMLIAIPTGVKVFNWIGTLWGGKIRFTTAMLYSLGFIWMFMMGGFTGIMHSSVPVDHQQQDSYFVVAHFHYVLIGGALFAIFSGIYYWMPKVSGKIMNELWGRISFWIMFFGFNLAFFPMHLLGMAGMPRRTHTYLGDMGWNEWNMWSTIGAMILGVGIGSAVVQIIYTAIKGKACGPDPWDARTLNGQQLALRRSITSNAFLRSTLATRYGRTNTAKNLRNQVKANQSHMVFICRIVPGIHCPLLSAFSSQDSDSSSTTRIS